MKHMCYALFYDAIGETICMSPFTHKINDSIEFFQTFPVVAADALLEIGTAVISVVLSLDEHMSQTDTTCVPKYCCQSA